MPVRTTALSTFLGVSNRRERTRLEERLPGGVKAYYLAAADNVDLSTDGFLQRRRGISAAQGGGRAHSIWGDGGLDGFAVVAGALNRLTLSGSGLVFDELLLGFGPAPVSFARMPTDAVAWSDGQRIGAIRDGVAGDLAPPKPNPAPSVSVVSGALPAGRYLLAFTRITADGESAATVPLQVEVGDGAGFSLADLEADTAVYMSGPSSDVLTRVYGSGDIVTLTNTGPRCETLLLEPMPAGSIVRQYNASLLVARGNLLLWSEPYRYGLTRPAKNFIAFAAPITVMEPCVGGVFVCADATYWLAGDLNTTSLQPVLPYGGVAGSGTRSRDDDAPRVFWVSPHGLVIGTSDGVAKAVQEDALVFSGAERAATLYREGPGITQAVFTRQGTEPPTTAARGYVAAERHRKETTP